MPAYDNELVLRAQAALDIAPNTNVNGTAIALGASGLPHDGQLIVGIDNPGGTGADSPGIAVALEVSLNNSSFREIARIDLGDPTDNFQGVIATGIGRDLNTKEYDEAEIVARSVIIPTGVAANNVTADGLWVFIGAGASTKWGREKAADTLFDA